jgi:hypothetical protein
MVEGQRDGGGACGHAHVVGVCCVGALLRCQHADAAHMATGSSAPPWLQLNLVNLLSLFSTQFKEQIKTAVAPRVRHLAALFGWC